MADFSFVYLSGLLPGTLAVGNKPAVAVVTGIPQPEPLSFGSFSPATGTTIAPTASLSFVVTGVSDERLGVALAASFAGTPMPELVYDGSAFTSLYSAASSYVVTGNTAAVTLVRAGGWPSSPTLTALTLYTV